MKRTSPLIAALGLVFAATAHANDWTSLSGIGDSIKLGAGQTALIVSVSEELVVHFDKPGRHRAAFRLQPENWFSEDVYSNYDRRFDAMVSIDKPFVLSGPATVAVRSPGVITMQIIDPAPARVSLRRAPAPAAAPLRAGRLPSKPGGWAPLRR